MFVQMAEFMEKAFQSVQPLLVMLIACINYMLFPDIAFQNAAVAVGCAMAVDAITKIVMLSKKHGGFWKAVKKKKITSRAMYDGTVAKMYAYLILAIMVGLSYRVVQLGDIGIFLGSVVYTFLFVREFQSVLENLCEGGFDLTALLAWTMRKQKQVLEAPEEEEKQDE